ncbi:hypothetical protein AYX15_06212 [Cryptococcus neoformans]|nr:hypothetical protein AYX15_06212 [Cryptococcus neoformans var. grubii]
MSVRKSPPITTGSGSALAKRARVDDDNDDHTISMTVASTSGLEAPIVSLSGAHGGEITACIFYPSGQTLAACSVDRSISLWRTYPPHDNYSILPKVHKEPILDIAYSLDSETIYSVRLISQLLSQMTKISTLQDRAQQTALSSWPT